jgi:putative restriction endonuclease
MSEVQHAWLLKKFGQTKKAGHRYQYDISKYYPYDNNCPNHKNIHAGDIAILYEGKSLIGIAKIINIKQSEGEKERLRCPKCNCPTIKERENKKPPYKCDKCRYEFDGVSQLESCTLFTANFGDSFIDASNANIEFSLLRQSCPRFNVQLAINEINFAIIQNILQKELPRISRLSVSSEPSRIDKVDVQEENTDTEFDSYELNIKDYRKTVLRQIRERCGQEEFRQNLKYRYRNRCMVTGCQVIEAIEAAHIYPYRGLNDNNPENGLLLRADIHTLFDLDLMGIEPESLTIKFHPKVLSKKWYENFEGKKLKLLSPNQQPSQAALQYRWKCFQQSLQN